MEIAVCVKPVPEPETRLRATQDGRRLDPEGVKYVLAGYDESAVEQALLLKEQIPGSAVRAFSFGPAHRTTELLRSCLALGCDSATILDDPHGDDDPRAHALALATVLGERPFDLVLVGKQALDDEEGLVAPMLGELLKRPSFSSVTELRWVADRSRFTFHRALESEIESWEAPAPLVIGLQQAWNDPRTPKLPNILKARRFPIETIAADRFTGPVAGRSGQSISKRFELPAPRAGAKMIEAKSPAEAAQQLVRLLQEEAKVFP